MAKPGDVIWVKCEVKPGQFSNERMVRVGGKEGWVGFVDQRFLRNEDAALGTAEIQGTVVAAHGENFDVSLPGHSVASSRVIETRKTQVSFASVPA